jgi:CheY-like chemotaxis protein
MPQRILLIDDDANIRRIVRIVLQRSGYEILEATNGSLGLAAALRERPNLILCDGTMPGMTGIETLAGVRADAQTRDTPFIFLTATSEPEFRAEATRLAANRFLAKPISLDELIAEVKAVLAETVSG